MALIEIRDISRYFGARCVFSNVRLSVPKGCRIGIVGRNGEGKTTLLRVIAGELEPDSGEIRKASTSSIGYLSQGLPKYVSTVFDEVMAGKPQVLEAASRMRELEITMAREPSCPEGLLEEYARAQARFENLNGYDLEHEAMAVLSGLGFSSDTYLQKAVDLSGGQKVRLNLAKLLVSQPDILLLDEPTNHLDIDGVEWLEEYLARYPGAVIMVSHDRHFLDTLVDRIWEVERGTVTLYRGNFSSYTHQKEENLRLQRQEYAEQQAMIKRTQEFIRKWKANARKVGQARSREKMLHRLKRIERPKQHAVLKLRLESYKSTGKEVLILEDFSKAFDRLLFSGFNFLLLRGERVALIGPNGCGKTTFLKCLMGKEPHDGIVKWGKGVQKVYYAQDYVFSSPERTVLDEVRSLGILESEARGILGRFLFSGDDVRKRVKDLSGGEVSRLALVRLVLSDANVLLLDEPTNHLDLPSRTALEDALIGFEGTIIFASHDRYFIDELATKTLYFEDQGIRIFEGNYSSFRRDRDSRVKNIIGGTVASSKDRDGCPGKKAKPTLSEEEQFFDRTSLKSVEAQIQAAESEIAELERVKEELVAALADPNTYSQGKHMPLKEWGLICSKLEGLYGVWEDLMETKQKFETALLIEKNL